MQSNAKQPRMKGKGWFVNEHGKIYVQGSIAHDETTRPKFYRRSTGLDATPKNITYIKKHHREVLLQQINKDRITIDTDFEKFGRSVIEKGATKHDRSGSIIREGRGKEAQEIAESIFERLIVPFFQEYSFGEISTDHVEAWVDWLVDDKEYSSSYVVKCKNILSQIMHKAVAKDIISKNPVEYIDKINVVYQKREAYTVEEAKAMMTHSEGWMHTFLNLAFTTGMRTGELLALKWEDVDWDHKVIYLQRSVSKGRITTGSSGKKNHSRIVPLMPQVVDILKKAQETSTCDWIFPSRKGKYYKESKTIVKWHFKPLLKKLGIKYKTLYATRHTFSTIVDNLMINPETIDKMAGNSKEVRDKHYVSFHMTKERSDVAQAHLAPVNNVFFDEIKAEVK